ncbi:MAG TPA: hypothetical protein PKZ83_17200 [bacterium]|nr:hypothetical protein [bacterium]HQJ66304.1 hypothetical protein [bacterium]
MTFIDRKSARQVTVIRRSQTQDAEGDYGNVAATTIHSGIIADIQPVRGKLIESAAGYRADTTHLMFTQDYFTDILALDIVQDGSTEYEVLVPANWREHTEYQLRIL